MKRKASLILLLCVALTFNAGAMEFPVGISLSLFGDRDCTQEQLNSIREAGVDYVEVTVNQFYRYHPEEELYLRASRLKSRIEASGLRVWSVHLPHTEWLDISFTNTTAREQSVRILEEMIQMASIFNPKRLVLHPSLEPIADADRQSRLDCARQSIGRLALAASRIGAVLCIENLPRTCLGRNSDEIMYLIKDYPEVMCCFDVNHLLKEDHQHFLKALNGRIGTVHLSDTDLTDERHWLEGTGKLDWPALLKGLNQAGYQGVAMHEVRGGRDVTPESIVKAYRTVMCSHPRDEQTRQLVIMGNNMLYIIDAAKTRLDGDFKNAILWKWDAKTAAGAMDNRPDRLDFIDECKVCDGGKTLLITGAHGFCTLLRKADKKVLFWARNVENPHSAELLPGGRVVVACSVGDDHLKLYDLDKSNVTLCEVPLKAAHGVIYVEKYRRLYAVGANSLNIYKLVDWETGTPSLELEKSLGTGGFVTDVHDLQQYDEHTLVLSGNGAVFFDMDSGKMTRIERFNSIGSIKSINCNKETSEIYYTYANPRECDGDYLWSSWCVRYCYDQRDIEEIKIPTPGINGYKVRIYEW